MDTVLPTLSHNRPGFDLAAWRRARPPLYHALYAWCRACQGDTHGWRAHAPAAQPA